MYDSDGSGELDQDEFIELLVTAGMTRWWPQVRGTSYLRGCKWEKLERKEDRSLKYLRIYCVRQIYLYSSSLSL